LEDLKEFKRVNGHVDVPKNEKYKVLGKWLSTQRLEYKKRKQGKPSTLDDDRWWGLETSGVTWGFTKYTWNEHLEHLRLYKTEFNHFNVPQSYKEVKGLAQWVITVSINTACWFFGDSNVSVRLLTPFLTPTATQGIQETTGRKEVCSQRQ
jgi:hypothetical protein